jgi:hypothetical protein
MVTSAGVRPLSPPSRRVLVPSAMCPARSEEGCKIMVQNVLLTLAECSEWTVLRVGSGGGLRA